MTRRASHTAKIVCSLNESAIEMMMPDAIDNGTPGQWIVPMSQPTGQARSPVAFVVANVEGESGGKTVHATQGAWCRELQWFRDFSPSQHMDRTRLASGFVTVVGWEIIRRSVHERWRWQARQL